jgi:hypothetical protein
MSKLPASTRRGGMAWMPTADRPAAGCTLIVYVLPTSRLRAGWCLSGSGSMPQRSSVEAWSDYVEGVVRLMIWHVWDRSQDAVDEASVLEDLDQRVDIMRKTTLFDGRHPAAGLDPPVPAWDLLKAELAERIYRVGSTADTHALEEDCWLLLKPVIEPKLGEYRKTLESVKARPYKCWSFQLKGEPPGEVALHFVNAYQPLSPFRDCHRDLVDCLRRLLEEVTAVHPEIEKVRCGSWLNKFPAFLALFPQSWSESFVPRQNSWATYGWWGQYSTHEGRFHRTNGERFRHLHHHPVTAGDSSCGKGELMRHLEKLSRR